MIRADWPTCFPSELLVVVSSRNDKTMLDRSIGVHNESNVSNRKNFLSKLDIPYESIVYQRIVYSDDRTYDVIAEVGVEDTNAHKKEIVADALVTEVASIGLFLPVADCIATVLYDPELKRVALMHLGRHSTLAGLLKKTVTTMKERGSNPGNMIVWFGPSVQKESYKLGYFDRAHNEEWQGYVTKTGDDIYIDMQGYNHSQAIQTGIREHNIHHSSVDTAVDNNYFSHSQGETADRFAVMVMIKS